MKRLALGVAAIAALATLTACGGSDSDSGSDATSDSTPSASASEPVEEEAADLAEDRFSTIYTDVAALFALISQQEDVKPADADEANVAAGLDETTPLYFVDYTVDPEDEGTGAFCLVSQDATYVSFAYSGATGEATLGDGDCSYDAADATVVGDVATDEWTVGGELMGDLVPTSAFGS